MFGSDVPNVVFAGDHLLFLRDTTLLAQPFDVRQLRLTGEAIPVAEQIARFGGAGGVGTFSASNSVLVYQAATGGASRLTWFRSGWHADGCKLPFGLIMRTSALSRW